MWVRGEEQALTFFFLFKCSRHTMSYSFPEYDIEIGRLHSSRCPHHDKCRKQPSATVQSQEIDTFRLETAVLGYTRNDSSRADVALPVAQTLLSALYMFSVPREHSLPVLPTLQMGVLRQR